MQTITHGSKNLFYSLELYPITEKITLATGTYSEGDLVEYDSVNNNFIKCTTAANIYGVITDSIIINADNTKGLVYKTGIFNKNAINLESGVAFEDLKTPARQLQIYFKDIKGGE